MHFLQCPKLDISAVDLFMKCIKSYQTADDAQTENPPEENQEPDKYTRLAQCRDAVETDAGKYRKDVLDGSFQKTPLPSSVPESELAAVYKETFSAEKKPGRTYYELIRGAAVCDKCPICGSTGGNTNLDHYLPKSKFPTLCVTPDNLIPMCAACNEKKGTYHNLESDKRLLHLYFERLPTTTDRRGNVIQETFLYARLQRDFNVTFYVQCPAHWPPDQCSRVKNHMKVYRLLQRYGDCIKPEIAKVSCKWTDDVEDWEDSIGGIKIAPAREKELLQNLVLEGVRYERFDPNSWRSALYRAMAERIDDTYDWFKNNEVEIKKAVSKYCNRS